jgi:thiol-disulfide isomerase/thioredoxin
MLTAAEQKVLEKLDGHLKREITIRLHLTDTIPSADFQSYCRNLAQLSAKIRIKEEKETENPAPALGIGGSILLHALPHGTALSPFMKLLRAQGSLTPENRAKLKKDFKIPAMLKLYISPHCPHCPLMMDQLFSRIVSSPSLHLTVIDVDLFPDLVASDNIKSVPTLIMDDSLRWTGSVDLDEVFRVIGHRDPLKIGTASLKSMIVNGDAYQLAEMMIRAKKIFPAFVDLLAHNEFSVRLGAMAAAEELVEKHPHIAAQLVDPLMERFENQGESVQGDILYILGRAGDQHVIPFLKQFLSLPYSKEVRESAEEALEMIQYR